MRRLTAKNVRSGLVTACRLAGWPTSLSPSSVNATIDGVVRMPSAFSMTLGALPSMTATHEFVVPRSMPMTLPIVFPLSLRQAGRTHWRPFQDCRRLIREPLSRPLDTAFRPRLAVNGSYRRALGGRKSDSHEIASAGNSTRKLRHALARPTGVMFALLHAPAGFGWTGCTPRSEQVIHAAPIIVVFVCGIVGRRAARARVRHAGISTGLPGWARAGTWAEREQPLSWLRRCKPARPGRHHEPAAGRLREDAWDARQRPASGQRAARGKFPIYQWLWIFGQR